MRPSFKLLQSGEAFTIEIGNLFYKGELNSFTFTEKDPTETNIRLQIQKLFDIFKNRATTERQKTKIDRFFANVRSKGNMLDLINKQ